MYTYLSILNVDVGTVLAYDKTTGALVAIVGFRPDLLSCAAGPANFDPTEAVTSFSLASQQALRQMCDGAASDAGADAQSAQD